MEDKNDVKFNIFYLQEQNVNPEKDINFNRFNSFPNSYNLGIKNGKYWFKLVLNKHIRQKNLIAYIPTHNISEIEIYEIKNNQLNYITTTGNKIDFEELPINYKFPAFKINTESNTVFYLKVNFIKEANFPIKIVSEKSFLSYSYSKEKINSFYYGTCIVVILLNLFFFLKFKDKNYLYYLLFLTSLMCLFLLYDGSLINLFRGNTFYYKLESIIHLSAAIWFLLFSITFLHLNSKHALFTKLFFIFPIGISILYTFYFIYNNYIFAAIGDAFGILLLPILWLFGFYYIKQLPYAKFFVLGYLLLIPFAVYFMIGFPFGLWKVNGEMLIIKISSWLDMFIFTYALSFKIKNQNEENKKTIIQLQNTLKNAPIKKENLLIDSFYFLIKKNNITTSALTLRELDILKAICEGLTNNEISDQLYISKNTVKYHIKNIYSKTNVRNRLELKEKIHLHLNNLSA